MPASLPHVLADLSVWWITTRAAGLVVLLASTASIVLGLTLAGRLRIGRGAGRLGDTRTLHQALGIATLVGLVIHVATLLPDPWLRPTIAQLAVPFALPYRPLFTGLGVIAGYGLIVLGLSGFLRRRLGRRWAVIHRLTGLAWALSIVHVLGAGSDASSWWLQLVTLACVLSVLAAAGLRVRSGRRRTAARTPRSAHRPRRGQAARAPSPARVGSGPDGPHTGFSR